MPADRSWLRTFLVVWIGQVASRLGTIFTQYALSVWVYQTTGSAIQYTLVWLFAWLPMVAAAPVAGALADRWSRRAAMIAADTGAALCTVVLGTLLLTGRLEFWHIYAAQAVSSLIGSLQWPAYSASVGVMVPKEHYGRASGMVQVGEALSVLVSPALGAAVLVSTGVYGVLLFDLCTALFAVLTLLFVRIPQHRRAVQGAAGGKRSLWEETRFGWTFIKERKGLLAELCIIALGNLNWIIVQVLATPLILGFAETKAAGATISLASTGMLAGTVAMSAWGGPRRKVDGVLGFYLLQGIVLVVSGLRPSLTLVGVCAFLFLFAAPVVTGCHNAIWLVKTPQSVMGRVFGVRRMITESMTPAGYFLAGVLSERVFEPLMAEGGLLAGSIGRVIGFGPGRGIALFYIVIGVVMIAIALAGALSPSVSRLEEQVPDAPREEAPAAS